MAIHRLLGSILLAGIGAVSSAAPDSCAVRGQAVVDAAATYVGVREATGHNDGVEVEAILHTVGLGPGYAWCGAYCYAVVIRSGSVKMPGGARAYAWAPSWHPPARRVWQRSRGLKFTGLGPKAPMPGDVFGVYYASMKRIGHVGIVQEWGDTVITLEGNTSGGGSRDGDGVYRRRRKMDQLYCVSRWHC